MTDFVIPDVGSSGTFIVNPPFHTTIIADKFYICQSVRSITDILAQGLDVLNVLYIPNNLTASDYKTDLAANIPIVTFKDELGKTFTVPGRYIKTVPYTTGYVYRTYMLGIALGDHEENYDFTSLSNDISDYVEHTTGIKPNITVLPTSARYHVPPDKHLEILNSRNGMTLIKQTLNARIAILTKQYITALNKIKDLEAYIKTHYNLP